jgi:7-keto-8-aminopelargonate synthetase-like enzyme
MGHTVLVLPSTLITKPTSKGGLQGTIMDRVDIITGTLGKAHGCVGGYIAESAKMVDTVRSLGPGFTFTTSLHPAIMEGAKAAIVYQMKYQGDRCLQQLHTRAVKGGLAEKDIPVIPNTSHIIPVLVGSAESHQESVRYSSRATQHLRAEHQLPYGARWPRTAPHHAYPRSHTRTTRTSDRCCRRHLHRTGYQT